MRAGSVFGHINEFDFHTGPQFSDHNYTQIVFVLDQILFEHLNFVHDDDDDDDEQK